MAEAGVTAIAIVECQRGVVGDLSFLPALAEAATPVLPAIGRLARGARAAGATVAHLTFVPAAGGRSMGRGSKLMNVANRSSGGWSASESAYEVVAEIGVEPGDLVLPRHQGISPVHRTEALAILRNLGVAELVLAGVSTNLAIPLAAAGAGDEGFHVVIPADAVAGTPRSHHESMMKHALPFIATMTTVDDLLAAWGVTA
jgi:nicotinamidase-related amidase